MKRISEGLAALAVGNALAGCQTAVDAPDDMPLPPEAVAATALLRSIFISWTGLVGADVQSYQVWRSDFPDAEFRLLGEVGASARDFNDTGVSLALNPSYKVATRNRRGTLSAFSSATVRVQTGVRVAASQLPDVGKTVYVNQFGEPQIEPQLAFISIERLSMTDFLALELICTHAGCGGMNLTNQIWTCRCHGSQFGAQGQLLRGPAQAPLTVLSALLNAARELTIRTRS